MNNDDSYHFSSETRVPVGQSSILVWFVASTPSAAVSPVQDERRKYNPNVLTVNSEIGEQLN